MAPEMTIRSFDIDFEVINGDAQVVGCIPDETNGVVVRLLFHQLRDTQCRGDCAVIPESAPFLGEQSAIDRAVKQTAC